MNALFKQTLAELRPDDVRFILASQPPVDDGDDPTPMHNQDNDDNDSDAEDRRRRRIERDWPETGTTLTADYFGTTYTAEIVLAAKRLKSGKQIRIDSGPAKGAVCDSFSEAMIEATEAQRTAQNLGRKGVSNGWVFWQWDGKPSNSNGEEEIDDLE